MGPSMGGPGMVMPAPAAAAATFDKSSFNVWLHLHALRVPKQLSRQAAKVVSKFVLDKPRIKHIVPDPSDPDLRRIILAEGVGADTLPEDKLLEVGNITGIDIVPHDILLDYDYWSVEHVLKELLPEGCEVPSAFECVGHIAHLNLRDELLPYRKVIAQVFLDKNQATIKTVVNKVGTITNEFRVPEFEVLAGQHSLVTEVKQHGATFRLDYGLVYWNSRLEFEHKRLVDQFKPGQVVCDMFAGIGPFAIPAAQRGCVVHANDLNPASAKYLQVNAKLNKVEARVHVYNMDAREFMRQLMRSGEDAVMSKSGLEDQPVGPEQSVKIDQQCADEPCGPADSFVSGSLAQVLESHSLPSDIPDGAPCSGEEEAPDKKHKTGESSVFRDPGRSGRPPDRKRKHQQKIATPLSESEESHRPYEHFDHVVMNLPASGLDFLDVFNGLLSRTHWRGLLPRVHCYCFMRSTETVQDIMKRAEATLNGGLENVSVCTVRAVAPNKDMLCLSFDLPEDVAFKNLT